VDLAVALALASSVANLSVPQGVIAVGEVGLAGEVRNVAGVPRRVAEAERMGFRRAIVPTGSDATSSGGSSGMEVVEVEDVREAMRAALRD
jgi:DNA repair protein RadA/Sms